MKQDFRYEQERDSKKRLDIQEVVEYILNKKYGETLLHEDLAKILRYNIEDEEECYKYKAMMAKVKKFLIQYGYILKGVAGLGYYILKPNQISRHCYKTYIKSCLRMYDKSLYILEKTDKSELNNDRQEEIDFLMDLNKKLIQKTEKMIYESPYYSRKTYYDNLED